MCKCGYVRTVATYQTALKKKHFLSTKSFPNYNSTEIMFLKGTSTVERIPSTVFNVFNKNLDCSYITSLFREVHKIFQIDDVFIFYNYFLCDFLMRNKIFVIRNLKLQSKF